MKKIILTVLFLVSITGFSQQIYFPKNLYQDSTALATNMPELAKKTIAFLQQKNENNKDPLFRLQLVAKNYATVAPTIRESAQETYKDSTSIRALGFPFRVYANTLNGHPSTKEDFKSTFNKQFHKIYDDLNEDGQNMVDQYYEKDLSQLKKDLDDKLKAIETKENLTVEEAVALCRSYCSYLTFSNTLDLAKEILKKISDEKYIVDENVTLTMPDGGTVALTVVRLRKETQPLPIVLMYNIYAGADISRCKEAANRGFVGIVVNTRGKRLSKDTIEPFEHDAKDAYEIIDWISKQSWCDGKIGMYGGSYLGFSQWSAVKKKHPALKTIVPQVAVGIGIDYPMANGVFMSYMLRWIHFVTNDKLTDIGDFSNTTHWNEAFKEYYTSGKSFRELDAIEGRPNAIFQRWLDHPTYDNFWQNMTPQKEEFSRIDIPILTTTGYYDDDQLGALYYYKQYQKWNKSDNYYLIIGPYDHFGAQGYPKAALNDYTIDEVANIPIQEIVFQWFNYTLKNGPKPELLKDKVNYQLMGANTWNHAPSLAKMSNDKLTFHLSSTQNNGTYSLASTKLQKLNFITQTIDFKDRSVVKVNSESSYCGFDEIQPKKLPGDKNLIVLESQPLLEPVAITGALEANLVFECNKKDLDIVIQLYEKRPDGTYFALSNNIQRASLAKDSTKRQLLKPNAIESIPVTSNFLACKQLQKGSQIVILLGVNNSPDWQINYGSGKDVSDETIKDAAIPLQIKWYGSSTFELPILK